MGRPQRRNRSRFQSVETLANALPDELRDPDMEPRDRLPAIGAWLRAHMVDPGLAVEVANAAGVGLVDWIRARLTAPGAADDHPVYRGLSGVSAPPTPRRGPTRPKPDLKVIR
jgi:hypothetical protein